MTELDLATIEQRWGLHNLRLRRVLLGYGSKGIVHLQAEEGEFVFKWLAAATTETTLAQQLALVAWLPEQGFTHVPRLRQCTTGEAYSRVGEHFGYLYHYVQGATPVPTPADYAQLGQLVATLHQVQGYTHPLAWRTQEIVGHILHDRAPHVPAEFRADYIALARSLPVMDHLPHALIHGDLALVNTVKGPDGALTLIDWDGGGIGVRIFDVAYLIFQWLADDLTFDLASAQAFFRAYLASQPLEDQEFTYLLDMSLLLPLNFILFGNPAQKWQRIGWLHQHRAEIMQQLMALRV
ncbi:hypothetical protein BH10CHL1_BH10CHL1_32010 [soil metagenome]